MKESSRGKYQLIFLAFLLLIPNLSSCYRKVEGFSFKYGHETVDIYQRSAGKSGRLVYRLGSVAEVEGEGYSFYLTYRTDDTIEIELIDYKGKRIGEYRPEIRAKVPVEFGIGIPRGVKLRGFSVEHREGDFKILAAGIGRRERGFRFEGGRIITDDTVVIEKPPVVRGDYLEKPELIFSEGTFGGKALWFLDMGLAEGMEGDSERFSIDFKRGNNLDERLSFRYQGRETHAYIYPAMLDFTPTGLSFAGESGLSVGVKSLVIGEVKGDDDLVALPAEPGVAIYYDRHYWRNRAFEIFEWKRFPGILIMDTADYETQSAFFKRIAFFVEKLGYAGKILPEESLEGRHGYNAHDYRSEDLALFFNRAKQEGVELNERENLLREIMLRNGLLIESDGILESKGGGIISFSRDSSPLLRKHLLTHECYHGIFFSSPAYRKACFKIWNSISDKEREFWKMFLGWRGYDISNRYLLVNEFQAYLFQQSEGEVDRYYKDYIIPRMLQSHPELEEKLMNFLREFPHHFTGTYEKLERELEKATGMHGGDVFVFQGNVR